MTFSEQASSLSFTREYKLPVKVVGVESFINNKDVSDNVDYNGSADISWRAVNPVYGCRCSFTPANEQNQTYCGKIGPGVLETSLSGFIVSNLKANTEFTVECPTYLKNYLLQS
jgi:hypothetical protein